MEAFVLVGAARAAGGESAPWDRVPPALWPVAGKACLEHALEELWEVGARRIRVACRGDGAAVAEYLGSRPRLGPTVECIDATQLAAGLSAVRGSVAIVAGDAVRGRAVGRVCREPALARGEPIAGTSAGRALGVLAADDGATLAAIVDLADLDAVPPGAVAVDVRGTACTPLRSAADLYSANLDAIAGRFDGLAAGGRASAAGVRGPRAFVSPDAVCAARARIGADAAVHERVVLDGRVEIGDGCVVDRDAEISDSVLLPGTYVGPGVRLRFALAWGPWLYRADLDETVGIDDRLLLSAIAAAAPAAGPLRAPATRRRGWPWRAAQPARGSSRA